MGAILVSVFKFTFKVRTYVMPFQAQFYKQEMFFYSIEQISPVVL